MITNAPITNPFTLDEKEIITNQVWLRYFTDVADVLSAPNTDAGSFTPVFTGLTESDSTKITKSGNFIRKGNLLFFDVTIVASGGATTSSILGTTSFALPGLTQARGGSDIITAAGYGTVNAFNVDTPLDFGAGYVNLNTLNAFVPTWTTIGDTISITGTVRIQGL